jgi:plastocyanin
METMERHLSWRLAPAMAAAVAFTVALIALLTLAGGEPAGASSTATASGTRTVKMANFRFLPARLHVAKGTRVVFSNRSGVTHTATGAGFDTGRVRSGRAVAVRFAAKGTYSYHCTIHPQMHGKITVG